MNRYAIIISGSRRLRYGKHYLVMLHILEQYADAEQVIVIHGAQEGADMIADDAAKDMDFARLPIPYFGHLGKAGGPARNRCIIDTAVTLGKHGYIVKMHALPDAQSRGTHDAVAYAKTVGVFAEVHPQ